LSSFAKGGSKAACSTGGGGKEQRCSDKKGGEKEKRTKWVRREGVPSGGWIGGKKKKKVLESSCEIENKNKQGMRKEMRFRETAETIGSKSGKRNFPSQSNGGEATKGEKGGTSKRQKGKRIEEKPCPAKGRAYLKPGSRSDR